MKVSPTIIIDVQDDGKPRLWVDSELIWTFSKDAFWMGKPLEMARIIEIAFASVGIYPHVEMPEDNVF